jgi:hypothetical protein
METQNNMEPDLTLKGENRKRKNRTIVKSRSVSSMDSISTVGFNVDFDAETSKTQPKKTAKRLCDTQHVYNIVNTMQEAYTQYSTFQPKEQALPDLANPPDKPNTTIFNSNTNTDMVLNVLTACEETNLNSSPKHSLVTLHSKGDVNLPKCHLAIEIIPNLITSEILDNFCKEHQFILEILLLNDSFVHYQDHLQILLNWARQRNTPILFTVPTQYSTDLQRTVDIELVSIKRPFQLENSIYTTT